ncbi:bifunctional DNA-formamidopyrimidine glycosylase/DNA-(apurinic or apyrimidinic site) lyase [Mycoplasmopsis alligatoris]|uniref:DNA-formamidopyrimidine glycosylase n=1 Tax=Mycoplasmopsis alligatoris A21JP2 TaxID=747682 RepID=D4XX08_9BACT|nr:bifunctional DNA-formamidopyrimidine glycosylase/DNA-(apurinic or apyrimidinic site) lyase [Mycoplasmopsis alligatoris]EFF41213.1 DNA-formamidopyrimidine glycosylase [Mycoplasmopsis alligatoris A21JP2]
MPEYPEVTVVSNSLNELVKFKKITKVEVNLEKIIKNTDVKNFINSLENRVIFSIENIGKYIIFSFDNDLKMISHLRMEGKFFYENFLSDRNKKHDLVIFTFEDNSKLIYNDTRRFGTMDLVQGDLSTFTKISKLANLPNPLDASKIMQKVKNKKIPIKTVLLDQSIVLGIGNIYADEVLFASKINPLSPASNILLKEWKLILQNAKDIMNQSTKQGGSSVNTYGSVNNVQGTFQNELKVYNRATLACLRCKNKLDKIKVNGRGTTFCAICQKVR